MTTAAAPFDPLAVPLAGTNLIEASAGTGKTWNIAELFARLVLLGVEDGSGHRRYPPADGILVVTFTKAATAELKTRLRARLNLALEALQSVPDAQDNMKGLQARCGDDSLFKLLKQALALEEQPRLVLRIQAALGGFDRAAIHTIHGFCQQVLREFPFYCGVPFDTQIDQEAARRRLLTAAQDFWRRRVSSDRDLAEAAYAGKLTPVQQLRETEHFLARPYLHERQPENPQSLREAQEAFDESWQRVRMRLDALEEAFWRIWPMTKKNAGIGSTGSKGSLKTRILPRCMRNWPTAAAQTFSTPAISQTKPTKASPATDKISPPYPSWACWPMPPAAWPTHADRPHCG